MKISLVMIVKNEENHIRRCLESIQDIVDEIIIADTGSNDRTIDIAREFGADIYRYKWCDDFAAARNFAADKSTGDWILVLDADEYVSKGNRSILEKFVKDNNHSIGRINIHSRYILNDEDAYSSEFISRFYPRGIRYKGIIHENLQSDYKRINIDFIVEHSGYYNTNKSQRNLPLLLKMLEEDNQDTYVLYQIGRTLYVDKKYREAQEYFKYAYKLLEKEMSYSKELIIYYLYSIVNSNINYEAGLNVIESKKSIYEDNADFNFVCGIFYLNLILYDERRYINYIPLIKESYLKCLKIGEKHSIVDGVGSFRAEYNLGVYFEVIGNLEYARKYYKKSASRGFLPAKYRMKLIE